MPLRKVVRIWIPPPEISVKLTQDLLGSLPIVLFMQWCGSDQYGDSGLVSSIFPVVVSRFELLFSMADCCAEPPELSSFPGISHFCDRSFKEGDGLFVAIVYHLHSFNPLWNAQSSAYPPFSRCLPWFLADFFYKQPIFHCYTTIRIVTVNYSLPGWILRNLRLLWSVATFQLFRSNSLNE